MCKPKLVATGRGAASEHPYHRDLQRGISMPNYLAPEDDGLVARKSGAWVEDKLDYLARYISAFETSMREKPWRARHYVDLLAGPGKCRVIGTKQILLGSPLIALTTEYPFTRYFFVDHDHANIESLRQRCSESPLTESISIKEGDCNLLVDDIVREIKEIDHYIPGIWSSINLGFLDSQGLELKWTTVAKLAKVSRMDMVINFPIYGLRLNMHSSLKQKHSCVDDFFGGPEWRQIYRDAVGRGKLARALLDFYKDKLGKLGYQDVRDSEEVLIRNIQRRGPLYYLIFVSKSDLGNKFWNDITRRNVRGQLALFTS